MHIVATIWTRKHIFVVWDSGQYHCCGGQSEDRKLPPIRCGIASWTSSSCWCIYPDRNEENPEIKDKVIVQDLRCLTLSAVGKKTIEIQLSAQ